MTPGSLTKNKSASDLMSAERSPVVQRHQRKVSTMANFSPPSLSDTINEDFRERTSSTISEQLSPLIKDQSLSPLINPDTMKRKSNIAAVTGDHSPFNLVNGVQDNKSNSNSNGGNLIVINQHHNLLISETETKSG